MAAYCRYPSHGAPDAGPYPPRAGRLRAAGDPIVVSTLVAPSIAITPCLWVALASRAVGGTALTLQAVGLTGLLLSLAGSGATRTHAYACGESVGAARGHQLISFALCAVGAGLAALSAVVVGQSYLTVLTVAVTATSALALVGLAAGRRSVVIAGVAAVNLAWSADLLLLASLGLRALLPGA